MNSPQLELFFFFETWSYSVALTVLTCSLDQAGLYLTKIHLPQPLPPECWDLLPCLALTSFFVVPYTLYVVVKSLCFLIFLLED